MIKTYILSTLEDANISSGEKIILIHQLIEEALSKLIYFEIKQDQNFMNNFQTDKLFSECILTSSILPLGSKIRILIFLEYDKNFIDMLREWNNKRNILIHNLPTINILFSWNQSKIFKTIKYLDSQLQKQEKSHSKLLERYFELSWLINDELINLLNNKTNEQ